MTLKCLIKPELDLEMDLMEVSWSKNLWKDLQKSLELKALSSLVKFFARKTITLLLKEFLMRPKKFQQIQFKSQEVLVQIRQFFGCLTILEATGFNFPMFNRNKFSPQEWSKKFSLEIWTTK
mgnify:CR=1 FL=1